MSDSTLFDGQALSDEVRVASDLARRAGAILMEIYATDFDVEFKSQSDPVTKADKLANRFLVDGLREHFPTDGIVAEETSDHSDATKGGRCWFVDPLDGTKEFIKKNGEFAVMLGLAIDGEARLGVVFQPAKDKLYAGVVDVGATLTEAGVTRPLSVSTLSDPAELKLVVSRSHRSQSVDDIVSRLGIQNETKSGSVGLKVGLIAERKADLYVHVSNKSSAWDACGPEAILRAAGGHFMRLDGKRYQYNRADIRNDCGILACNKAAYDNVLPVASKVAADLGLRSK